MLTPEEMRDRLNQYEVQMAGVATVSQGWGLESPAKRGDYRWSATYQDVLDLRVKYEALLLRINQC